MDASVIADARFEPVDDAGWRRLAEKAIEGADFSGTLETEADDGFRYGPIHARRCDATVIGRTHPDRPWRIAQRLDDPDIERAKRQAADDLANGADTMVLAPNGTPGAYGFGLAQPAGPTIRALAGTLDHGSASIRLEGSAMAARALADCLTGKSDNAVHFGIDPVSAAASTARNFGIDDHLADIAQALKAFGFAGTVLQADGRIAHNAGASEAQELAFVLASLTALARACERGGMAPETTFALTGLGIATDQQQLLSIAKLRALRLLHTRLQQACGIDTPLPAHIHAETSFRMLTALDPETNILRNTIAAFSAGVGGADSVSVLPHTLPHGLPDAFARRVARNTQVILIHESHLDHVADPSAGSGAIEALTDALAEAAWAEFQAIEAEGGIMASLGSGAVQKRIAAARDKRIAAVQSGALTIIGTTHYQAAKERPVAVLAPRADKAPRSRGSGRALRPVPLDGVREGDSA